jgi:membrane-associated phospholipid phosphatase
MPEAIYAKPSKSDYFRIFSCTLAQAYATNGILTQGLKCATHRIRPDESASKSFPSGHASDSFTVATVVSSQVPPAKPEA